MAPKQTITKKMIVDGAFRIYGKKGIAARPVADFLGCSTQPVYSSLQTNVINSRQLASFQQPKDGVFHSDKEKRLAISTQLLAG